MALEDDIARLKLLPMLAELESDALRLLAFSAEMKILRQGDVLFSRGDASDCAFVVIAGSFELCASDDRAQRRIVGANAMLGEIALLTATNRPATAVAREPSTVLKLPRTLFHRVLQEFPRSARRLHDVMTKRVIDFAGELRALNLDPQDR